MKILVFAEKPSVGRDIARILGASGKGNGFLEGNNYIVTWGFGHLVSIAPPEVQNPDWKKWSLHSLPMLPTNWVLTTIPSARKQFDIVAKLFNRDDVKELINAADAGREGELIFRLVYQHSSCKKPFKRLWISSMTDEAIKDGFADLMPGEKYDPLARAAQCRSRADWLVGMNFTRGYTKKYNEMLTLGRVQTPTLAMVVGRHLEIENFVPRDYWEIAADFSDFSGIWFDPEAAEYPTRIDNFDKAQALADLLAGKQAKVHSVKKTKKKQQPPFLYDLTSLQRDANSKFGMTAAETLSALQNLYEKKKVVTYPRTDSRYLSEDIFPTIEKRIAAIPGEYDHYLDYLRANRPKKEKRVFNDAKVSDHHAIIPTEKKVADMSHWPKQEQLVYDLVVRRFLAAFYPDHEYLSTQVIVKAEDQHFKANGKVVTAEGWRALYPKKNANNDKKPESEIEDEENDQSLPVLKKGDGRIIAHAELLTKKTKPPSAFTESTLLQAMETAGKLIEDEELRDAMKDCGLGTPATRAEIIEKLIKVGYMVRDKKKLVPTPKGLHLISLAEPEIKSPELTGNWEKRLADIARGKDSEEEFMKDISEFVVTVIHKIKSSRIAQRAPQGKPCPVSGRRTFGVCPACGKGQIIEGNRGFGCNRFREGCNYVVWKEFYGKKLSESAIKSLIEGKPTRTMKGFVMADGSKVSGKIAMKQDKSAIELIVEKSD
ncbi:MAG: DNA topoisomerase 3 [Candidatus Rifleibacteriota bacterium]